MFKFLVCLSLIFNFSYATVMLEQDIVKLYDYLSQIPTKRKIKKLMDDSSSKVVLIYTISHTGKDTDNFFNTGQKPRKNKTDYKFGVTSGILVSGDGVVLTTYDSVLHADEYIVSIDSEKKSDNNIYGKLILTKNDYYADVIRTFPHFNLAFLKIKTDGYERFPHFNLSDLNFIKETNFQRKYLCYGSIILSKCKGEHLVNERTPYNNKNKFDKYTQLISRLTVYTVQGRESLVLYNPFCEQTFLPESNGGAIIRYPTGELLGIVSFSRDSLYLPQLFAIPVSIIKQALSIAVPTQFRVAGEVKSGIEVGPLNDQQKKELKKVIKALPRSTYIQVEAQVQFLTTNKASTLYDLIDVGQFGVVVTGIDTTAYSDTNGLRCGDIILMINEQVAMDQETVRNIEFSLWGQDGFTVTIMRKNNVEFLDIKK